MGLGLVKFNMTKFYLYGQNETDNVNESFDENKLFSTVNIELKHIGPYFQVMFDEKEGYIEFYIFKRNLKTNEAGIVKV